MSDQNHCPFLNRSDVRCSTNFSIERLSNTYDYCFGEYSACSVYLELLVERRVRRLRESVLTPAARMGGHPAFVQVTHAGRRIAAA
ncbi:MAG TPA: hypothetical protein VFE47_02225 [Tepidisphaeraceae bacterium]|nr:hypothetical protein [Tepidisphaeraceae bacterium]